MKKRLLSILMVTAMCATMAVGCGTADDTKDSSSSSKGKSDYLVGLPIVISITQGFTSILKAKS